jgi:hypothetical protein
MVTGGTSKTSTPRLKFRMKRALLEADKTARHIEHCASVTDAKLRKTATATVIKSRNFKAREYFITDSPDFLPAQAAAL